MDDLDIALPKTDKAPLMAKRNDFMIPKALTKAFTIAGVAVVTLIMLVWIGGLCWLLIKVLIFLL